MTAFSGTPHIDGPVRRLVVVLGDQLNHDSMLLEDLEPDRDAVLMMEVRSESMEGPSHRMRTAFFLSAMRHFAIELEQGGHRVRYVALDDPANTHSFSGEVARAIDDLRPDSIAVVRPGDWRVYLEALSWHERDGVPCEIVEDRHFLNTPEQFRAWADGRKSLTMEYFYREQRKRLGVLMDGNSPEGGRWNYDSDNREIFRTTPETPPIEVTIPDAITTEVITLVDRCLPGLPGRMSVDSFIWPVTRDDARTGLRDFIEHRLPLFGKYEDAMWSGKHVLYHSLLSPALNVHLLDPRECVEAALAAYKRGDAPLNSVEGFVRQLIGWREFIRGVYWLEGPGYRDRNWMGQTGSLPDFYWSGETDMTCVRECLTPVLDHAWSHHIPRLMVLSNLALISGVSPRAIGDWFYGMYTDSVDWVTTPNTIGMAMHADGERDETGRTVRLPVVGTKPYAASGKYISRMSNYCRDCVFDVNERAGEHACPFNTFYWDFLIRHRETFRGNNRMAMILKNVDRLDPAVRSAISTRARTLRTEWGIA
ncbi:MAG: cryptochrome/photolyase family protein [Planctomycetota bacterium]